MKTHKIKYLLFALIMFTYACDSTEPDEGPGEEELITLVTVSLVSDAGTLNFAASDPDGDGAGFTIDDMNLASNTTYQGSITFEDTVNGEDITEEVEEEADEHQVHYLPSSGLNLTAAINDTDSNELPLGLDFTLTTGDASTGTLRVVLGHYDDDPKDGTSLSDESDVDINYSVTIADQ